MVGQAGGQTGRQADRQAGVGVKAAKVTARASEVLRC